MNKYYSTIYKNIKYIIPPLAQNDELIFKILLCFLVTFYLHWISEYNFETIIFSKIKWITQHFTQFVFIELI